MSLAVMGFSDSSDDNDDNDDDDDDQAASGEIEAAAASLSELRAARERRGVGSLSAASAPTSSLSPTPLPPMASLPPSQRYPGLASSPFALGSQISAHLAGASPGGIGVGSGVLLGAGRSGRY